MTRSMIACLAVLLAGAGQAQAGIMIEVRRIDDLTAILVGSGTVDVPGFPDLDTGLILREAVSFGDLVAESFSGDFLLGGTTTDLIMDGFGTTDLAIEQSGIFGDGDSLSGSVTVTLSTETWGPVGYVDRITGDFSGELLGEYRIVSHAGVVPEPTSLAIFGGLGIAGLVFGGRSRRIRHGRRDFVPES